MNSKAILSQLIKWFSGDRLSLNYDKTNFLHFRNKNSSLLDTKLEYDTKAIDTKIGTKFLGIMMDSVYFTMESSYLFTINETECRMLYSPNPKTCNVSTGISYGLFLLFPLDYVLWRNILGCFPTVY
jgi:hypothetical protein